MTTSRWEATLDAFAGCLAEQERLLAEDRVAELPVFAPAPGLGPLPASLVARARELQARSAVLTDEVGRAAHDVSRQLALARRLASCVGPAETASAVFLDQMA